MRGWWTRSPWWRWPRAIWAAPSAQAQELEIERALGSYEALLEDPEVDAVYVPLPNSMHVEWSIRALEAGKHVLCEKPLARAVEPVERAFDAAERAGRVLTEGFMWRHHPQAQRLVELLPRVGELRTLRAQFSFAMDSATLAAADDIRLSGELEGGALMDVGCYCVSGVRLVAGEPLEVTGEQVTGGDGVDVRFAGTLRCAGDVLAHFDCGVDTADRAALEVAGSEGYLLLQRPVALARARDRAACGRRLDGADRGRARQSVRVRAARPRRRGRRRAPAAARARGRRRAGQSHRGAVSERGERAADAGLGRAVRG